MQANRRESHVCKYCSESLSWRTLAVAVAARRDTLRVYRDLLKVHRKPCS